MKYREVSNDEDILDIRDVFERIDELEDELSVIEDLKNEIESLDPDEDKEDIRIAKEELKKKEKELENEAEELEILSEFISDFAGYGNDEKRDGEWYPAILVRDSYWENFVASECEELGYIPKNLPWYICIDWEKTAERYQQDYTSGTFDGVTYWGRSN